MTNCIVFARIRQKMPGLGKPVNLKKPRVRRAMTVPFSILMCFHLSYSVISRNPLHCSVGFCCQTSKDLRILINFRVISEEILHSNVAHWWSTEGSYILYATFDDTEVPKYSFPNYGPGEAIYGYVDEIAYPKVRLQHWSFSKFNIIFHILITFLGVI